MNQFERNPEEKDPLEFGRFSMTNEERERITQKALAEGKDPQEALREYEERLAEATIRLREKQGEKKAIKDLERDMNK